MTPVVGDLIQNTVGRVVERLAGKYLPETMSEKERADLRLEAERLALDEYRAAVSDVQGARQLAMKEAEGAPSWAALLRATHRPAWSFLTLAVFVWTILAPYFGYPEIPITDVHKSIMQTVIIPNYARMD